MNDLLNIELVDDIFKKRFVQSWEETLMALETRRLSFGRPLRRMSWRFFSDHVQRKESESYSRLKALVTDVLEDQQQLEERISYPSRTSAKQSCRETRRLQSAVIERLALKRRQMCVQAR